MGKEKIYDAAIVGSGASGGLAAKVLAEKGLEVIVLEAGPPVDPARDFKSHTPPWEMAYRGARPPEVRQTQWNQTVANEYNSHFYVKDTEHPYTTDPGKPFVWIRSRIVGGKTLHWGRLSWRLSPYDFKAGSHDGYGDDWPIAYEDLAPYYDKAEGFIGVSGSAEGLKQLPDGNFLPPMPPSCQEVIFRKAARSVGLRAIPMRAAMLTRPLKGQPHRAPCHYCGHCSHGCDVNAMFSSISSTLPAAEATGRYTLRPNSIVRKVLVDPNTGKARGLSVIDRESRQDFEIAAKAVVLGASTLESTRILFNSKSAQHPNGLANSSGALGHYLMDHFGGIGITGFLPMFKGAEITNTDGKATGTYIPRFRNLDERHPDFIRGYGFEAWSFGAQGFPWFANSVPGFGAVFKEEVKRHYPALVSFTTRAEMLARYENRVSIDPNVTDNWGIPVLRFSCAHGDNERKMAQDALARAHEIMEAAGAEVLWVDNEITAPGVIIHELGTCRMGNDSKSSVLNRFNQAHDVKNLFVVDGGCFVSSACQNPTLTILALTWRACDYLADEFRQGNL